MKIYTRDTRVAANQPPPIINPSVDFPSHTTSSLHAKKDLLSPKHRRQVNAFEAPTFGPIMGDTLGRLYGLRVFTLLYWVGSVAISYAIANTVYKSLHKIDMLQAVAAASSQQTAPPPPSNSPTIAQKGLSAGKDCVRAAVKGAITHALMGKVRLLGGSVFGYIAPFLSSIPIPFLSRGSSGPSQGMPVNEYRLTLPEGMEIQEGETYIVQQTQNELLIDLYHHLGETYGNGGFSENIARMPRMPRTRG